MLLKFFTFLCNFTKVYFLYLKVNLGCRKLHKTFFGLDVVSLKVELKFSDKFYVATGVTLYWRKECS